VGSQVSVSPGIRTPEMDVCQPYECLLSFESTRRSMGFPVMHQGALAPWLQGKRAVS